MVTTTAEPMRTNGALPRTRVFTADPSRDGSVKKFTVVEGVTTDIPVWVAALMLGIEDGSVRALVVKNRIEEVPRDEWPNGKCQMVKLASVEAYRNTRGPSRFRTDE